MSHKIGNGPRSLAIVGAAAALYLVAGCDDADQIDSAAVCVDSMSQHRVVDELCPRPGQPAAGSPWQWRYVDLPDYDDNNGGGGLVVVGVGQPVSPAYRTVPRDPARAGYGLARGGGFLSRSGGGTANVGNSTITRGGLGPGAAKVGASSSAS